MIPLRSLVRFGPGVVNASLLIQRQSAGGCLSAISVNVNTVTSTKTSRCFSSSCRRQFLENRKFSTEAASDKSSAGDNDAANVIAATIEAPSQSKKKNKSIESSVINSQEVSRDSSVKDVESSEPKIELDKLYKTLELEVLAYEPSVLNSYQWFVITAATHLGIHVGKSWAPLKSDKYRFPLLKSAFVHKKHQVQYEVRTYHRFLTFHKLTGSTADTFLEYVERNLPEGVGLKVTKVEAQPLPEYLQKQSDT